MGENVVFDSVKQQLKCGEYLEFKKQCCCQRVFEKL